MAQIKDHLRHLCLSVCPSALSRRSQFWTDYEKFSENGAWPGSHDP